MNTTEEKFKDMLFKQTLEHYCIAGTYIHYIENPAYFKHYKYPKIGLFYLSMVVTIEVLDTSFNFMKKKWENH